MRDDVHRRAPLPTAWRRLLAACGTPAEFRALGRLTSLRAAESMTRRSFSAGFLKEVVRLGSARQLEIAATISLEGTASRPLEHVVVRESACGRPLPQSLEIAMRSQAASYLRETEAYLASKRVPDRKQVLARMTSLTQRIDFSSLARRLAAGEPIRVTRPTTLSIDGDLR